MLSGSTHFLTVPTRSESPVGRAVFIQLWPLTVAERTGGPADLPALLFTGPDAFAELDQSVWDRTRISMCFAQIQATDLIPRLLGMLAARAGSQTVVSDLAKSLEINHATARSYLTYLETVFLTALLPPWSSNLTAKYVKSPKVYPTDSGLAAHLLGVDAETLRKPDHACTGILTETFVFAELTRLLAISDIAITLSYYRDRDGHEIDFIMERRDGRVVGLEVKPAATVANSDFRHLRWLADRLGDRLVGGYVLYLGSRVRSLGDRMTALPLSALWGHAELG